MTTRQPSSLLYALKLLQVLGTDEVVNRDGGTVGELAAATGRDKSQVSRALAAMAEGGFVDRDPATRRYRLGWHVFALSARAGDPRLLRESEPVLTLLTRQTGESSHLTVLRGDAVLTLRTVSPSRALQATSRVGRLTSAHNTSSGRALLLDHDLTQLVAVFGEAAWDRPTANTPRDVRELFNRISRARAAGWVRVEEESEPELVAVAAPIRDGGRSIIAALNVSGPKFRLGPRLATTGDRVLRAAGELSERLSRRRPDPTISSTHVS